MRAAILVLVFLQCVISLKANWVGHKENGIRRFFETVFDQIASFNQRMKKQEQLSLFEGDIELVEQPEGIDLSTVASEKGEDNKRFDPKKRSLRRSMEYLWVDRVIPYEITPGVENSKDMIIRALEEIEKKSCLSFVERTKERNWIKFENKGACYSSVGRSFWREGSQRISLTSDCLESIGTIIHEVLHALGFWHEQSRPDRDNYIEILWENIAEGEEHNFEKYSRQESDDLGRKYDMSSIMHYGRKSFSKNDKPTIQAIDDPNKKLGQREKLSVEDVIQLNALYKCQDLGKTYTSWSSWSPCDKKCQKSRQRFCPNFDKSRCPEASDTGVHTIVENCDEEECYKPVNGHWGRWSSWSECNQQCGGGEMTRTRECNNPEPKYGGSNCEGDNSQTAECYIKPCGLNEDDCLFDGQQMCFWQDMSNNENYKWERIQGKTPSRLTGPDGDHSTTLSTKDGYYMFTESSAPALTGNKASLVSKAFGKTNARCMTFFYSMHGLGIGALRVFVVTVGTDSERKIWEKQGPQGAGWKLAEVEFSNKFVYKIKFEAERGPTFQGDIGLDDVLFRDGRCSVPMKSTERPTTKMAMMTTTITPMSTIDPLTSLCGVPIRPLGCFVDMSSDPSMELMLDSHRKGNRQYHGVDIDWNHFHSTLKHLLRDCVNRAKASGMKYIGLQYYGECWGSRGEGYNRYGISTRCIDSKYEECYRKNKQDICVGKAQTNYIYELV